MTTDATPAAGAAAGGYQPTAEELLQAAKDVKAKNPDFGVKRVWSLLKEKGWVISEARVKKVMQESGLSESTAPTGAGSGAEKEKADQSAQAAVSSGSC